jgi:hypothetical protein
MTQKIIKINKFPNDSWTRVEIFLRAYGRLPETIDDKITKETLELYCKKWEAGELKTVTVDLEQVYKAIKRGEVYLDE